MIREGRLTDFQAFWDLANELREQTMYADVEPDRQLVMKTFAQCLNSARGVVLVAERKGKLTGVLLGVIEQLWFARARFATDLMFHAKTPGDGVKLVRRFIEWAKAQPNVFEVTMGVSSGMDIARTGKLYQHIGMKPMGGIYTLEVGS